MKWGNKCHELDGVYRRFRGKGIYIFGAGTIGRRQFQLLNRFFLPKGFIDNDRKKWDTGFCGHQVSSLDEYVKKDLQLKNYIIVCVGQKWREEVIGQLEAAGLCKDVDFFVHDKYFSEIFPVIVMYEKDKVYMELAQVSLTERCTLRCKKCAHSCNLVPRDADDLSFEEACQSVDNFFAFVDFISEFVLIGGEPLLYKDLAQIISYTGERYREQMGVFSITTNGTILPDRNILKLCKKYNVTFRISNYSVAIPKLKKQYEKLTNTLDTQQIDYTISPDEHEWMDYGFEYVDRKASPTELEKVFDACMTPCHEIRRDRFYFCVMARTVAENMNKGVGKDDYLYLSQLSPDRWEDRMKFFEYTRGYSDKGYLDMCNYCHGAESKNYPIPAAEQMER